MRYPNCRNSSIIQRKTIWMQLSVRSIDPMSQLRKEKRVDLMVTYFAEDHTHSVLNTVTNKEVNTALEQAVDVI